MTPNSFLSTATTDGRALLAAAETRWDRQVPHCPEWDAAGLVRHTGGIFDWMAAIVASGDRVSRRTLDAPPEDPTDLAAWYLASLDCTVDVLGSADPGEETWTFSSTGDRRVAWWCRRLAVEVAIHRHDAEHAFSTVGGADPVPLNGEVAAAGIEDFIVEFLPGLLASEEIQGLDGTLRLHATDGPFEWWVDLNDPGAARPEHEKTGTVLRGSRSSLLLWLTNRAPVGSVEVIDDQGIATAWTQLCR
jgi:uncharacterized protein (TIGR03083 family)